MPTVTTTLAAVNADVKSSRHADEVFWFAFLHLLEMIRSIQPTILARSYDLNLKPRPVKVTLQQLYDDLHGGRRMEFPVAGNVFIQLVDEMESRNSPLAHQPFQVVITSRQERRKRSKGNKDPLGE